MLREGTGAPLVLLHGILGSERMWEDVVPLLADRHEVIAPTLLGHRGGHAPSARPASVERLVEDVERVLAELGLGQVHVAGNSMGGWVALELARRGRALSVCALSPAGAWQAGTENARRRPEILLAAVRDTRRSRRLLPLLARSRGFRRWALRNTAAHGEQVSRARLLALADDVIGCEIAEDLLLSSAQLAPLDPAPCPITLAWSARDRLFPVDQHGARARELIPEAQFLVLDGVGHVPMLDDPRLVARTILEATARAT
jgi:pimeloyl-ACP methyl ester carboxylesterase